jgi:hypothetical protein
VCVIDHPYGPGPRRGWPGWLIATIGIVGGLVLLAVPATGGWLLVSESPADSSSGPVAAPPSPTDPTPDPGVGVGRERLDIDFPDGSTGSFAVPVGMQHDADGDDEGHIAMWSADSADTPYLDVYTEDTAASRRSDLSGVAAQERADEVDRGGRASTITYRTVGGHRAAQFTVQYKGKYADQAYEDLVTVVVVGRQALALYFEDQPQSFDAKRAHTDTASLIASFRPGSADDTT